MTDRRLDKAELDVYVKCFGKAVEQMRELRGISREELAKKSKIKLDLLTRIEEGKVTGDEFGLGEIFCISGAMNMTAYRLMPKVEQLIKDAGAAWW